MSEQVRTYDVYPTVLEHLELIAITEHEGTPLSGYLRGEMKGSMWCVLLGHSPSDSPGWMVGLRYQGFKYMVDVDTGEEWLFDLNEDVAETNNLVSSQEDLLNQVRSIVKQDREKLEAL